MDNSELGRRVEELDRKVSKTTTALAVWRLLTLALGLAMCVLCYKLFLSDEIDLGDRKLVFGGERDASVASWAELNGEGLAVHRRFQKDGRTDSTSVQGGGLYVSSTLKWGTDIVEEQPTLRSCLNTGGLCPGPGAPVNGE